MDTIYAKRRWLMGATCQFHVQLSIHIQAMIQGGVFDRFPGAQIIVGHLGENLVCTPCPRIVPLSFSLFHLKGVFCSP